MKNNDTNNSLQILEDFNKTYFDRKTTNSSETQIAQLFENNCSNWEKNIHLLYHGNSVDGMYGSALLTYSAIIDHIEVFSLDRLEKLRKRIDNYEKKVKFHLKRKAELYSNLANVYAKKNLDNDSVECFKKYFFYLFSEANKEIHEEIICFAFHSLSKHMFYNLSEETLNVSSPLMFNDVFDCPLIKLLDNDDGPSKLKKRALCDCVKIACFDKNEFLPTVEDLLLQKRRKKNEENNEDEYCNELLWSHYADYHKGICIEYVFNSSLFNSAQTDSTIVSFFKDVNYLDNIDSIKNGTNINLLDGFFVKSRAWRYENELRFFHFDLNGSGDYSSVKIPNCVKSITFGAQCPEKDKILVMKLMHNRNYSFNGRSDNKIEFYQMKPDDKIFGKVKRELITLKKDKVHVKGLI